MKIVVLEGFAVNPGDLCWDCLNTLGEVTVYDHTAPEEAAAQIGDAEIVLINKTPVTAQLLDTCPGIKLICVQATGYNVVDCDAAKKRGIPVCNVPAYGTPAVSQFTFSLLLELCNRVGHHDRLIHDGEWNRRGTFSFWDTPQMELAGKTIGIIGYGKIGKAVGVIAKAFGMKVLAYSRSATPGEGDYVTLDTLLAQSDIVSLHCPLTEESQGMINKKTIAQMKDGAILINTARGAMIVEEDVADALKKGKLAGAAMDVVCQEPISPSSPLLTAPNCVITPHMAWAPLEARQRVIDCSFRNIEAYLKGAPINVVNP
ncbi:MAG: D-2-hydroxyacid dehydrogenase [Oscillospiraceae bacterium]|nr:D-2-hydroxyacid dehydrogenase [Oscillospiraceae bacterium]